MSVSRLGLLPVVVAAWLPIGGGCQQATTGGPMHQPVLEPSPGQEATAEHRKDTGDEEGAGGLAELARRDVEAFLARREQPPRRAESGAEGPEPDEPEIHWNHAPWKSEQAGASADLADGTGRASGDGGPPQLLPGPPSLRVLDSDALRIGDGGSDLRSGPQARPVAFGVRSDEDGSTAEDAESPGEGAALDGGELVDASLDELLAALARELYRDAAEDDVPLKSLLLIAAASLRDPERSLAPEAIPGLTAREREVLASFQRFFGDLGRELSAPAGPPHELIVEAVEALQRSLHAEPVLEISTIALCTRVGGFGDYDAFDRYAFLAHSDQQVVFYLEIAGFTSAENERGDWVTDLLQQLTIYSDRDGIPVWRDDWQRAVDVSRNRRQDFFLVQVLTLPNALSVGRYHLKVRLRDENSGAEAEGSITFEMVADPRLAASPPGR